MPAAAIRANGRGPSSVLSARFGLSNDFVLPRAETVTQLPLSVTSVQESNDVSLQNSGRILINTSGQYRIVLVIDWSAQNDADGDRRMIGLRRWPGSLPNQDDRLASVDACGSHPPNVPTGTQNIIAMNTAGTRGESKDGWQVLRTAAEDLAAGQVIYAVVRSRMTGDYVQATRTTFLQIERFG
jgi:hypothetical protein